MSYPHAGHPRANDRDPRRVSSATPLLLGLAILCLITPPGVLAQGLPRVDFPMPVDLGLEMLEVREWAQQLSSPGIRAFHDFTFTDQRAASGITFENRVVEDAGKQYKAVHYDHGNGVALADVDGDGLLDVYFTTQLGGNELWQNLGGGRFRNITAEAGADLGLTGKISVAASFGDIDNDGDPDLYVTTVKMGNHLFRNNGGGRFEDTTAAAGLTLEAHSSGAVFFDYDRDGLLDLFVTNVGVYTEDRTGPGNYRIGYADAFSGHLFPERTEQSVLYRNLGDGRFEDVSEKTGLVDGSWSGDAAFSDVNDDGWPDLYVLNMQGDDHYYENRGGESFVDRTTEVFPVTPWGSMGIGFFDWNNDGRHDLMLTDMHSDMSREVSPGFEKIKSLMVWGEEYLDGGDNNLYGNAFYSNLGDSRFEEISDAIGAENYWPWGFSVGDVNADGWQDAFLTSSMNFPYRYGVNTLLLNEEGESFRDAEFLVGIEPREAGSDRPLKDRSKKPWFVLDCSAADRGHRLCQGRNGTYEIWGSRGTRSSAIFDIDGDGDLDILTNEFNDRPQVLVSDLSDKMPVHWLEVRLQGTESNRDALGAEVRVSAGDSTWVRVHDGKSGYLSQSSLPLYFGLGSATAVDRVDVEWPSGKVQTVDRGIPVNGTLEIVEE